MKIVRYTEKWRDAWDTFVRGSNNGTIFHLQQFLDYHPPGRFHWHHLMFIDKGQIAAILPGTLENGLFESPIGASYGGIITPDIKFRQAMELISTLLEYGAKNGFKTIMLTPAPLIYEKYPNQNMEFAMLWQGFKYELHYISSAICLDPSREIIDRFQATVRRNIRKTLRDWDIRCEINERYDEFYPILVENKARHHVRPTHSLEELIRLKELLPESLKLFMVYLEDTPIGGSVMFFANDITAICFYNMLRYDFAQYKPIHRVMYEVVKYCTEHGYRYVDIGVSQDTSADNPMTPSINLIDFKEKFDAKTIMRNTLRIDL